MSLEQKLTQAIIDADSCCQAWEGVSLLYFMDGCGDKDTESFELIKQILEKADEQET